mmetsp:Transcript_36843/g.119844  ORF Transcript_36843/g.119844 Transcript_36843/m.119844 type:complete len:240 (-) Transcript_36843:394-1113(-)
MTALHSLTSMPRAATSVAIITGRRPLLKSASTISLSRWSLSPWITPTPILRPSCEPSESHIRLVEVKTMTREPASSSHSRFHSRLSFSSSVACTNSCDTALFADGWPASPSPPAPPTKRVAVCSTGRRKAEASLRTCFGHVAEKSSVCRASAAGSAAKICFSCGSKPMSSIRSASSITTYLTSLSRTWPDSRKSLRRPGVQMISSAPRRSSASCPPLGAPPYRQTERMPEERPKRSHSD